MKEAGYAAGGFLLGLGLEQSYNHHAWGIAVGFLGGAWLSYSWYWMGRKHGGLR